MVDGAVFHVFPHFFLGVRENIISLGGPSFDYLRGLYTICFYLGIACGFVNGNGFGKRCL